MFRDRLKEHGGNLSAVAKSLKVSRGVIYQWADSDTDFAQAIKDIRGEFLDECISISRVLARGIPEKDETMP
jgi:hypothetical protein